MINVAEEQLAVWRDVAALLVDAPLEPGAVFERVRCGVPESQGAAGAGRSAPPATAEMGPGSFHAQPPLHGLRVPIEKPLLT